MRNRTVTQNEQPLHEGSRWVLYHGTSTPRLNRILEDGRLRTSGTDDPKMSLTTERSVAEYWACHAVFGDRRNRTGEDSSEVVLVIDGEGLLELNYDLSAFSDPIWGEGECDWENEIACWDDIEPLDEVLI
jgi:RNA:NAD 2'-phosphotransferase (TPT1/KptA family)